MTLWRHRSGVTEENDTNGVTEENDTDDSATSQVMGVVFVRKILVC